ncbi:MAG: RluA family pseudouridine synthase [SAR202 cluster bacterium]|nr:RluA family pseudouridine synthase [SAR202 cluster bacterium]
MTDAFILTVDATRERLDLFVTRRRPELSRARVQRLIEEGHVTVDGAPAKSSLKPEAGQTVRVEVPEATTSYLEAQAIPLKVVYEDQDILVVDKPAGMTVHPAPGHKAGTLANALLARIHDLQDIGGRLRPGIVHRLDKDTSGLLVVAKNDAAFASLTAQFKARHVHKTYLALVQGTPHPKEASIEAPVGRSRRDRKRMAVVEDGRPSVTHYRVVRGFRGYAMVEAMPVTGRTHQIRVHLASIGHPVVGDATYGKAEPKLGRQFLHAARLELALPSTGRMVEFASPLPPQLEAFLEGPELL